MKITYEEIHLLIDKISNNLNEINYKPDLIVAIGSGGLIPAKLIKKNFDVPIINFGIKYYDSKNKLTQTPIIYQDIIKEQINNKNILLVDEIDDTWTTLKYALQKIII